MFRGLGVEVGDVFVTEVTVAVVTAIAEAMYVMLGAWCACLAGGLASRAVEEAYVVMYIVAILVTVT